MNDPLSDPNVKICDCDLAYIDTSLGIELHQEIAGHLPTQEWKA